MSDKEKLASAEEFVRKAVSHLSLSVDEAAIQQAAQKAAKSLPPYDMRDLKSLHEKSK